VQILFFQCSFFNYFTSSLGKGTLHFIWRHVRYASMDAPHKQNRYDKFVERDAIAFEW